MILSGMIGLLVLFGARTIIVNQKNRIWNIDIDLDNFREHGNAYTIAEAKAIAKDLWKKVFEKAKKWNEEII